MKPAEAYVIHPHMKRESLFYDYLEYIVSL